jgi:hypothetical protein
MWEHFFKDDVRIRSLRDRPNGLLLEGFAEELCRRGYAEVTAAGTSERLSVWFIGPIKKACRSRI